MPNIQRRIAAGAVLLGAFIGFAAPAQAAEKEIDVRESAHFVTTMDNPCTPDFDEIAMTADVTYTYKLWVAEDGSVRYREQSVVKLAGLAADGTRYVGSSPYQAMSRVEDGLVHATFDVSTRLSSQGSSPNFTARYKVLFSYNLSTGESTWELIKDFNECQG
ncbi:MAG: hypothetical protein ACRD12_12530 [Acidimicrobiales bacterium]